METIGIDIAIRKKPDIIIIDVHGFLIYEEPKPPKYYVKIKRQPIFPLFL
jgi:hypothetical protein